MTIGSQTNVRNSRSAISTIPNTTSRYNPHRIVCSTFRFRCTNNFNSGRISILISNEDHLTSVHSSSDPSSRFQDRFLHTSRRWNRFDLILLTCDCVSNSLSRRTNLQCCVSFKKHIVFSCHDLCFSVDAHFRKYNRNRVTQINPIYSIFLKLSE